ncbi:hypothetical protein HAX54_037498 [Datura stramonium]|uniref:Uncharacterized protein n=1 Tax=Datura stramonium TaxID=4076 RepID=A0ABS8SHE7_DATST|nr:hypothetical protein [Datura stramonium]
MTADLLPDSLEDTYLINSFLFVPSTSLRFLLFPDMKSAHSLQTPQGLVFSGKLRPPLPSNLLNASRSSLKVCGELTGRSVPIEDNPCPSPLVNNGMRALRRFLQLCLLLVYPKDDPGLRHIV